jgi:integrase
VRYRDLELARKDDAIVAGRLIVPKSKTDAGTGRVIPFTRRLCVTLSSWIARFPNVEPESYIFPHHRDACRGGFSEYHLYETDLRRHRVKRAWKYACRKSGVASRWHNLRHTFVSCFAENPAVSEETIPALAGHVSKQMLQRYSHIRIHAKEAAILGLEGDEIDNSAPEDAGERAQNWAQSPTDRLH